jgi:hypothetical protein
MCGRERRFSTLTPAVEQAGVWGFWSRTGVGVAAAPSDVGGNSSG